MNGLEAMIREVIREEVRRLVRSDALAANQNTGAVLDEDDEAQLRGKALEVASRFRRARAG